MALMHGAERVNVAHQERSGPDVLRFDAPLSEWQSAQDRIPGESIGMRLNVNALNQRWAAWVYPSRPRSVHGGFPELGPWMAS